MSSTLIVNQVTPSACFYVVFFLFVLFFFSFFLLVKKSFHCICDGSECVVVEYKLIEMTPRSMFVKKALEFCDPKHPLYKGEYDLLDKNCENFARGLVEAGTDKISKDNFKPHGRSTQVDKKVDLLDMATNWDEPPPMVSVEDYPSE